MTPQSTGRSGGSSVARRKRRHTRCAYADSTADSAVVSRNKPVATVVPATSASMTRTKNHRSPVRFSLARGLACCCCCCSAASGANVSRYTTLCTASATWSRCSNGVSARSTATLSSSHTSCSNGALWRGQCAGAAAGACACG